MSKYIYDIKNIKCECDIKNELDKYCNSIILFMIINISYIVFSYHYSNKYKVYKVIIFLILLGLIIYTGYIYYNIIKNNTDNCKCIENIQNQVNYILLISTISIMFNLDTLLGTRIFWWINYIPFSILAY